MNDLKSILNGELKMLEHIERDCRSKLEELPEGTIYASKNKNMNQYYRKINDNQKKVYIRKQEKELISGLVQREYSKKIIKVVEKQGKDIKRLLANYNEDEIVNIYINMPFEKRKYVKAYQLPEDEYVKKWVEEQNNIKIMLDRKYPNKHSLESEDDEYDIITEKGEIVRSKSEKIIADKLYKMRIPYVYEVPIVLKGWGCVRPDFTVLNVKKRKTYRWEHFGKIDDKEYSVSVVDKINKFEKNGLFIGKQIIATFESGMQPLSVKNIERKIEEFLL